MAGIDNPKKSAIDDILECSLCLQQLKVPHTLKQCLHSYCKECIEAVPKKIKEGLFHFIYLFLLLNHCTWRLVYKKFMKNIILIINIVKQGLKVTLTC